MNDVQIARRLELGVSSYAIVVLLEYTA